jgi:dihydrofolate synthase/folylpolyglutamate synthase
MVNILTLSSYAIIFCRPKMERAAKKEHVQKFIRFSEQNRVFWFEESSEALEKALSMTSKNDLLCVTGSLFVVGEVKEYLMHAGNESTGRIPL